MKRIAFCILIAVVIAAAAWGESPNVVAVPVSGQYWEPAAGGLLNYSGVMTLTWLPGGGTAGEWPMSGTFVGQAWCVNTGAGYLLYGVCSDCLLGTPGTTVNVEKSFLALDGQGQPAFEKVVNVVFSLPVRQGPPVVTEVAFAAP